MTTRSAVCSSDGGFGSDGGSVTGQYRTSMAKAPVLFEHPSSLEHDTGEHPERAERMTAIFSALARREWLGWERRASPAATRAQLTAVHSPGYVSYIEEFSLRGGGWLDQDTAVSDGSFAAGCHA